MIVTLLNKKSIASLTLPEKVRGQYSIENGEDIKIDIEGIDEKWIARPGRYIKIFDENNKPVASRILDEMVVYNLDTPNPEDANIIFTEPSTIDRIEYSKYLVPRECVISIGRNPSNDIVINNKYVSSSHARLAYRDNSWSVSDLQSSNGTFVNRESVSERALSYGDFVYIMGTRIIVGKGFFAINDPDGTVQINNPSISRYVPQPIEQKEDDFEADTAEENIFYRSPRFKRDIETAVFKIDAPPGSQIGDEMPLMMAIGPSMTMGMASMATAIYGVTQGNYMSTVTSGCMLLGTVMWPIISKRYEKKRRKKREELRQKKYQEYLDRIRDSFSKECEKQRKIILENSVSIDECEKRIVNVSRNLWERSYGQNDFLKLNIGRGVVELDATIQYPERKFEIERDMLEEELLNICEAPHVIKNVPLSVSFFENRISGVIGDRKDTLSFAKGLILQLSTLYSYDEVKLVFIYDEKQDARQLDYVKWLPHIWNNDKSVRFLAKTPDDIKDISVVLEGEYEARNELKESELEDVSPYYVIFAFNKGLALKSDALKKIYESKKNLHFSVITFFDELKNLPKECSNVIELDNRMSGKIFDKNDISGQIVEFTPDIFVESGVEKLSVRLANIRLNMGDYEYKIPKMITFLEMFGVGKIEHLNILSRWKENDPTKSLEAQIGVDVMGEAFKLDLHEKYHGPHGLVAGMTGSGKSEFIMTYILSLAINYHPNEVAFVLIDYKGGGMAKAFETLPHTAGIITNLDGSAINRSLISIQSELRRRQSIFAEASKQSGISNIDIYKYQKMYREGSVSEPLQHLFIISDEFAELKTQQPDFMTQLVSAARIGRSLGVHLILATQKPSGVVDDQIWSNAKFKACLKVQDKADSMDMLKRPEAAELQDTGRFYLQVGYNEMFMMGQSAWAGAPYYPADRVEQQVDDSVDVIDNVGRVIGSARIEKRREISKPKKQIDAITDYLAEIAEQEKIKVRPLWLDPIPAKIYVKELAEKYGYVRDGRINPVIGEYDDPMNQRQALLTLNITDGGNTAVYGMTGSGKTSFLTTLCYSLMETYTPEEVNIYILDFSSETLAAFAKAPHVGDVVLSHESEKVINLLKLLMGQIQTRKKLFADYGGDIVSYNTSSGSTVPSIIVMINGYAAYSELYADYEDEMLRLTREGTKYGIYFVLAATGISAIRFRLQQNIGQSFALRLSDETDYSSILGKTGGLIPDKIKGRGLFKAEEIYEFQTATVFESENEFMAVRAYCEELRKRYADSRARSIPVLPERVDEEFIEPYISEGSLLIPVGVETESLEVNYVDLNKHYIYFIESNGKTYSGFLGMFARMLAVMGKLDVTVFDPDNDVTANSGFAYMDSKKSIGEGVEALFDEVLMRHNSIKEAEEEGKEPPVYELRTFLFASLAAIRDILSDEQNEKLGLILEKGSTRINIRIIIAEATKSLSSFNYEKWYQANASQSDGLWVGSGITDQYYLKISNSSSGMGADISEAYGYVVKNGKAVKVKLISNGEGE